MSNVCSSLSFSSLEKDTVKWHRPSTVGRTLPPFLHAHVGRSDGVSCVSWAYSVCPLSGFCCSGCSRRPLPVRLTLLTTHLQANSWISGATDSISTVPGQAVQR